MLLLHLCAIAYHVRADSRKRVSTSRSPSCSCAFIDAQKVADGAAP